MMIHYLEHNAINKKKWDDCIRRSSNGMVYAYSWFLDIVSPNWNALIADDYQAVFPLTQRKKYGFHYLYQPNFTQQLGFFSASKNKSEKMNQGFLDAIPGHYRLIEIQLNSQNTKAFKNFKTSERLTHLLDLNRPYEKIYALYSENLKRNLKRALKNKIEISSSNQFSEIIRLFRNNKGRVVGHLKNKDFDTLNQLIQEADHRKLITALTAKTSSGKLCAGAFFLQSSHEYIFLFSGLNEEARRSGAMSLLIDHFIRLHASENMNLDFEGSMDKNLARFYKSFGSEEIVYLQVRKNNLPSALKWMKS